jgi:hypothetical protein
MASKAQQIAAMVEMLPEQDQQLAFELVDKNNFDHLDDLNL